MSGVHDYQKVEVHAEEWHDVLSRKILPQTKRLHCLAVSGDGRACMGLSSTVTILNPSLVFRAIKSFEPPRASLEEKRGEPLILNSDIRAAKDIRPSVLGHEVVFEVESNLAGVNRSDTELGGSDIACVAWGPTSAGSVLFFANGKGSCFLGVPNFSISEEERDGTWGGLLGLWNVVEVFPSGEKLQVSVGKGAKVYLDNDSDNAVGIHSAGGKVKRSPSSAVQSLHKKHRKDDILKLSTRGDGLDHGILSLGFCKVFKNTVKASSNGEDRRTFIVFGTKQGTFLRPFRGWVHAEAVWPQGFRLHAGWTSASSCFDDFEFQNQSMALVAVGGPADGVSVYGVWHDQRRKDDLHLSATLLWKSQPLELFGPVPALSWSMEACSLGYPRLVIGAGNDIVVVNWTKVEGEKNDLGVWKNPEVLRISEAHSQMVSSIHEGVNGSMFSSSLDGTIKHWKTDEWSTNQDKRSVISYSRIQDCTVKSEAVMGMERTTNGLGVFAVTTTNRTYTEVHLLNEEAKYAAGSRRSVLSLYVLPPQPNLSNITRHVLSRVQMLASGRRFIGEAISLWDVEMFMDQQDCEMGGMLQALRKRFYEMLESLKAKKAPIKSRRMHEHYSRVVLCLADLILRVGGTDIPAIEAMERARGGVVKSVLCSHYDECLRNLTARANDVNMLSHDECCSLESMCQFISVCSSDMMWDAQGTLQGVSRIRGMLEVRISVGESMAVVCPVCKPDCSVPLVSDAEDAICFYCAHGDVFTRCVVTGLPMSDAVPLVCYGCEARALKRDFDPYADRGQKEFGWIAGIGSCPQCMAPLLPSSVEMQ